jgi:uncharacterized paraquat-inducible protein A
MPRWNRNDDNWDAEPEDDAPEDADWSDDDDDDDEPTVACPYCGCEIHEEAQRCPHCENYLSAEDSRRPQKPWWLVLGAVACLYAVYRWIVSYNGPGM